MRNRDHEATNTVCIDCFKDQYVRSVISERGTPGTCPWCHRANTTVVPLSELCEAFRDATRIYVPSDDGDGLGLLLQEDFDVFQDPVGDDMPLMDQLTTAILKAWSGDPKDEVDYPDYDSEFSRPSSGLEEDWHERVAALLRSEPGEILRQSIHHDIILPDRLGVAIEDLSDRAPTGARFFRARIHRPRGRTNRLAPHEMGAPAPENTPAQRANRRGEPVLYLSSDSNTALAEVRAWKGAAVAVADFTLTRPVWLVDLTTTSLPESPFDNEYLEWRVELAALLNRFAYELSLPLIPGEEDELYRPSQYLCQVIRAAGGDGIRYPSAMGTGFNVVLFDQDAAVAGGIEYIRVTGVEHQGRQLSAYERPYEPWVYAHVR